MLNKLTQLSNNCVTPECTLNRARAAQVLQLHDTAGHHRTTIRQLLVTTSSAPQLLPAQVVSRHFQPRPLSDTATATQLGQLTSPHSSQIELER